MRKNTNITYTELGAALALLVLIAVLLLAGVRWGLERTRLGSCQSHLKQLGLVFRMYANESRGELWPPRVGVDAAGGRVCWMPDPRHLYPEYLKDPILLICPADPNHSAAFDPTHPNTWVLPDGSLDIDPSTGAGAFARYGDASYTYTGYLFHHDNSYLEGWDGFHAPEWDAASIRQGLSPLVTDPTQDHTVLHDTLGEITMHRLREGVERFLILDIMDPARTRQSQAAAFWDVVPVDIAASQHRRGCNVLYMDGHVEFVAYPSHEFPVNPYMAHFIDAVP
jgi:prepilin-type processing-associated H-X9-DG protein